MRTAVIDIGTNTILMLVAEVQNNRIISIIRDEHYIARLGAGVDENGRISQGTFIKVANIIEELKSKASLDGVTSFLACGTSALRDSVNRSDFIDFIKANTSIDIRVISGEEEAELTYLGAVSEYLKDNPSGEYAVLDIGGGSTELVAGTGDEIKYIRSIDMGSVRLTERILKINPPSDTGLDESKALIKEFIQNIPHLKAGTDLLGVAGTLTTLAALDQKLEEFDGKKVNGYLLNISCIEKIFLELKDLSLSELRNIPQIHSLRADIILAGILILMEILKKLNTDKIKVSDKGLRYGLLEKLLKDQSGQ